MNEQMFFDDIKRTIDDFLVGRCTGSAFVRRIDDLMADHLPEAMSGQWLTRLHRFHEDIALYVEDGLMRKEDPAYYGLDELRKKVTEFNEKYLSS
jgi:hypothetical protein